MTIQVYFFLVLLLIYVAIFIPMAVKSEKVTSWPISGNLCEMYSGRCYVQ